MIRYALNCAKGHSFESWFQNSSAYDKQARQKLVTCPVCGPAKVEKEIMSPRVSGSRRREGAPAPRNETPRGKTTDQAHEKTPGATVAPREARRAKCATAGAGPLTRNAHRV